MLDTVAARVADQGVDILRTEPERRRLNAWPLACLKQGSCLSSTEDGAVVARFPMSEALLEERVSALPYFSVLATSGAESWTGWAVAEPEVGGKHLVSARRLHGWPLIVTASIPGSAVYASSWTRLLWHVILATLLVAALLLLAN